MIKILFFFFNICFFSSVVYANEEAVISLFEDEFENQADNTKNEKDVKEDFFSFMNLKIPENIISSSKTQKELPTTIEEKIKLADRGDLKSQLDVGYAYLYGEDGVKTNYEKAFEYYGKAALQNDPVGLNNLGTMYYSGLGITRDVKKASALFKKAVELGNTDAAVSLGFMHASGRGAQQDMELALNYFEKALSGNSTAAKFMVGYAYYTGKYREINYSKAAPLLKEAAEDGFDEAQNMVADVYMYGLGFPQNYSSCVKYLNKSVAQGNTSAMMKLADILVEGKKYNKDIAYAHVLYNLASVRGVSSAVQKRNNIETTMKIEEILAAQQKAASFKESLSPTTQYIRQTYGESISAYFK